MKPVLDFIKREPAMLAALVLALANLVWKVTEEDAVQLATIIESVLVLVAGKVVREQVTPVAAPNLPPSRKA